MSLSTDSHGGGCCGINHIFNFPHLPPSTALNVRKNLVEAAIDEAMNDAYDMDDDGDSGQADWRSAIECVLAGPQLEEWRPVLLDCGFKEVFSFHNSNSGNNCHVFYHETGV